MDDIINVIIKLLATLLGVGLAYLGKLITAWIKGRFEERELEKLRDFISTLVAAAEQIYKNTEDVSGIGRYGYVVEMLENAGYQVTDKVRALIESSVFEINVITGSTKESGDGGN